MPVIVGLFSFTLGLFSPVIVGLFSFIWGLLSWLLLMQLSSGFCPKYWFLSKIMFIVGLFSWRLLMQMSSVFCPEYSSSQQMQLCSDLRYASNSIYLNPKP
jgi:hypothetical protein